MKTRNGLLTALCLAVFFIAWSPRARAGEIAVIVHKRNPVGRIDTRTLRSYFTKIERNWPDGSRIIPLERDEGSDEYALFAAHVYGKTQREMALFWIKRKSTTGDSAPKQISSDSLMILTVGSLEGAVGYVDAGSLDAEALRLVKVAATIRE